MTCKCSPSLLALRDQLDAAHPHRSTASDGCCGDARHQREVSDHNPVGGYAHAFDITQDPAHGVDCNLLAVSLITDPRTKYVIWNRRIYDESVSKTWRRYTGVDPHTGHLHLSILLSATHDTRPWPIGGTTPAPAQQEDELTDDEHKLIVRLEQKLDALTAAMGTGKDKEGKDRGPIGGLVADVYQRTRDQGLDLGWLKGAAAKIAEKLGGIVLPPQP